MATEILINFIAKASGLSFLVVISAATYDYLTLVSFILVFL